MHKVSNILTLSLVQLQPQELLGLNLLLQLSVQLLRPCGSTVQLSGTGAQSVQQGCLSGLGFHQLTSGLLHQLQELTHSRVETPSSI